MKPADRNYLMYLEDIVISIKRIQEYIEGLSFQDFHNDYKTVDAVVRNFEIVGEAVKNLPSTVKTKYPNIPWEEMYRLRNLIIHEYFGIDHEILWEIATAHLPQNLADLEHIYLLEKQKG